MIEASFVRTDEGIVIREIGASNERAWRLNDDRTWAVCLDHKGPWVSIPDVEVPVRILHALQDLRAGLAKDVHNE